MKLDQLILELYAIQAVKFGSFTLKSGAQSPIYLDLRVIISKPKLLKAISDLIWEKVKNLSFDLICGVPYTALPIATCLSLDHNIPMILKRKESKEHGTKKILEGIYEKGHTCLIIEDVITTGGSILETMESLSAEGIQVKDVALVIDRQQGGKQRLEQKGLHVYSLLTMADVLHVLQEAAKISVQKADEVKEYLKI